MLCFLLCIFILLYHITILCKDLVCITLHGEKYLICVQGWLYKCALVLKKHGGQDYS